MALEAGEVRLRSELDMRLNWYGRVEGLDHFEKWFILGDPDLTGFISIALEPPSRKIWASVKDNILAQNKIKLAQKQHGLVPRVVSNHRSEIKKGPGKEGRTGLSGEEPAEHAVRKTQAHEQPPVREKCIVQKVG